MCELHVLEMRKEGKGRAWHTARFPQPLRSQPWRHAESPTAPTARGDEALLLRVSRLWHTCTPRAWESSAREQPAPQTPGILPPSRRPVGGKHQLWTRCETVRRAAAPHSCQNSWLPTDAVLLLAVRVIRQ